MDLPVTVGRIPPGMQVVAIDTGRAQAQLAGKGRDLLLLKLRKPAFRLNLTNDIPGRARVKLGQDQSNLPATVQLVSARPEYVNVDVGSAGPAPGPGFRADPRQACPGLCRNLGPVARQCLFDRSPGGDLDW